MKPTCIGCGAAHNRASEICDDCEVIRQKIEVCRQMVIQQSGWATCYQHDDPSEWLVEQMKKLSDSEGYGVVAAVTSYVDRRAVHREVVEPLKNAVIEYLVALADHHDECSDHSAMLCDNALRGLRKLLPEAPDMYGEVAK